MANPDIPNVPDTDSLDPEDWEEAEAETWLGSQHHHWLQCPQRGEEQTGSCQQAEILRLTSIYRASKN